MLASPTRAHRAICLAIVTALLPLAQAVPSAAAAGSTATVTVRVQGLGGETLLSQTQVTTNTTPIAVEGGGTCEGTSAGGAIYDATAGKWKVKNQSVGVELQGLEGLDLPEFNSKEPPGIYWAFWLEGKYAAEGICSQSIASGQHIVLFPQCYAVGPMCQSATAPSDFLTAVPTAVTANVGQQVQVTLGALNTETALPESALPEGDLLADGAQTFAPATDGVANVSFSAPGLYTLQAHAPDSVASEPFTICVHDGEDGTCGTHVPSPCPLASSASSCGPPVVCPAAASTQTSAASCQGPLPTPLPEVARAAGVVSGHAYPRRRAPRILAGSVEVPVGNTLHEVRIALNRRAHGRCYAFSGPRAAFVRASCRAVPRFFAVASTSSFTYLLPARLRAGRYVYDVEAVNDAGQVTPLTNGVSHVAFSVR
jgi:hypothetical protein